MWKTCTRSNVEVTLIKSNIDKELFKSNIGLIQVDSHGLTQKGEQTLELIISSEWSFIIVGVSFVCEPCLSDHLIVQFFINMDCIQR